MRELRRSDICMLGLCVKCAAAYSGAYTCTAEGGGGGILGA